MIKLQINKHKYEVSTSFMTLVRYVAETGKSFIADKSQTLGDLAMLIYCGIQGKKPNLQNFFKDCAADALFSASAFAYLKEVFKPSQLRTTTQKDNLNSNIDELTVISLWTAVRLPFELLETFSLAQVSVLIDEALKVKNGGTQTSAHEMTAEECKAMYNIAPEREKKISEFLKRQKNGE